MNRMGKGSAVSKHVNDYCVVDLETTNSNPRIAEIVEISALKVRDNQVIDEFSVLVNPCCHIPADATAVNHITDDMVKDAPILEDVIDAFLAFVGNDVIVGYNNAAYDMNILYDKILDHRGMFFGNDYIDLLHAFRRAIPELENHKLETVSKYYGLDTTGEHRALKDCYLTNACYEHLVAECGDAAFQSGSNSGRGHRAPRYTAETRAVQELQGLLEGIIADGKVAIQELIFLAQWLVDHEDLRGDYLFDRAFTTIGRVVADGKVTQDELDELQVLFSEFVDPVKSQGCHEQLETLQGKHIVVTGDFDYGTRNDVNDLLERAGCIIDNGVKKVTNYVVVGSQGSQAWKTGKYGAKIQRAMEYIDKGIDIKIIEEAEFIPNALDLIEQPHQGNSEA